MLKKIPLLLYSLLLFNFSCRNSTNNQPAESFFIKQNKGILFFVISDFGANGSILQQRVAEKMAEAADSLSPQFIISCGDQFHLNGVESVNDPIWLTNYEWVYKSLSLHVDWYPVLGNHEYQGNIKAVIDYSKISRRWKIPEKYYTLAKKNSKTSIRFIFLDTTPFVEFYRDNPEKYPQIVEQNSNKQLIWLDSVLINSNEKWKIVVGHHPIFSFDDKHGHTYELISKIRPVLNKYNVDFYFSGHIHAFQHIQVPHDKVEYVVNTSAARPRYIEDNIMTKFVSSDAGYLIATVSENIFNIYFVNEDGQILYSYSRVKN